MALALNMWVRVESALHGGAKDEFWVCGSVHGERTHSLTEMYAEHVCTIS